MMMKALVITIAVLVTFFQQEARAQGTFQNLDFESVRNVPFFDQQNHPWMMPASDALPGWACYVDAVQIQNVMYSDLALDSASVGVVSSSISSFIPIPTGFIEGNYSASLQAGIGRFGTYSAASLAQTGEIPAGTKSIRFKGYEQVTGGIGFTIAFAGNKIPLQVVSTQDGYNIYGGDVSQFAGQTGALTLSSMSHFSYVDGITFSTSAVPEPAAISILFFGLACFILAARRRNEK